MIFKLRSVERKATPGRTERNHQLPCPLREICCKTLEESSLSGFAKFSGRRTVYCKLSRLVLSSTFDGIDFCTSERLSSLKSSKRLRKCCGDLLSTSGQQMTIDQGSVSKMNDWQKLGSFLDNPQKTSVKISPSTKA